MKSLHLLLFLFLLNQLHAQVFEWAAQMGGMSIEEPFDILIDETDNSIYLTGFFYDDFEADPNGGNSTTSIDAADAIIIKLDASGNYLWANQLGGQDIEMGTKLALDDQQNVIVVVNASPKLNIYKFNGNIGSLIWFYSSDYSSQANGYGVTLDADQNIYVSGTYTDTVDFDNSMNTQYLISEGNEDGFVLKLDADGNYIWAKSFGHNFGGALFRDIEWHTQNQLYVSGYFYGQVDFDPSSNNVYLGATGTTDGFLLRLDTAGNYVWALQTQNNGSVVCNGLTIDHDGDLLLAGDFTNTVSLDPNGTTANYTEEGNGDFYVQKLDTNGNLLWATAIGGSAYDQVEGIAVDQNNNVYITGKFTQTVDFNPSSAQAILNAGFYADAFVLKLTASGDFGWALPVSSEMGFNSGKDVTIDANNKLLLTGTFSDTTDLDPTAGTANFVSSDIMDWFVIKLDLSQSVGIEFIAQQFGAYPNPCKGNLTINSPVNGEMKLYDLNGQLLQSKMIVKGAQQLSLHYPAGIYLLEIADGTARFRQKVQLVE